MRSAMFFAAMVCGASLAVQGIAQAQWWNDQDPTFPKEKNLPTYKPKYTRQTYYDASQTVHTAIREGEFAKVERMYDEFLATRPHAGDGPLLMGAFLEGLDSYFSVYDESDAKETLEKWRAKLPDSRVVVLAKPVMLQRLAWKARGSQYAGQVPGESTRIFQQKLAQAARALAETQSAGSDSPLWYWAALVVAGSTGEPPARMDAIFEQAVKRFPDFLPIYYTRMNYLLPQWGGDFQEVDRFVKRSVERTQAQEGSSFYVWLYLDVIRKTPDDPFTATGLHWPTMRKAFQDLVTRYPDPWNRNLYATYACRARDRETTGKLLAELGNDAKLGAWAPGVTTESCRRFALSGA